YLAWTKKVPAFIPKFSLFKPSVVKFSLKKVLRREYSGLFAAVIGFQYVDLFREYFSGKKLEFNAFEISVLSCAVILTLVLKYLKKFTTVLN
ncbi:MAG: lipid A phosphate methyltransferase, partial [Bacteroidia bacterium]